MSIVSRRRDTNRALTHPVAAIWSVARSRGALSVFQRALIKLYVCCCLSVIRTLKRCVGIINSPLNRNQHQKMFSPLFYLSCSNTVTMQRRERLRSCLMIPHKPHIVFQHWGVFDICQCGTLYYSQRLLSKADKKFSKQWFQHKCCPVWWFSDPHSQRNYFGECYWDKFFLYLSGLSA